MLTDQDFGLLQTSVDAMMERLASLQGQLRCGTNCGSCVPELKRMARAVVPLAKAA